MAEDLAPGARFGDYVIARRLGKGAYGCVYEALRQPLNRRVALKVLHRQVASQDEAVARFLREAELVASLDHPHIVSVFDVGMVDEIPYLAMEFLEGRSLGEHLKHHGALPLAQAVDLLLPIFSAVATVHERGVVHRDLKPDNILLALSATGELVPKLLDFGIAKVTATDHGLTNTNALMGTPFYMSPEQAKESKHIDGRTDQWALAVIAWQCVAGRKPFRGNNLLEVLNAVAHGPIEPLRLIVPEVPADFEATLHVALRREPDQRYPSVWDFGLRLLPHASALAQSKWREHFNTRRNREPAAVPAAVSDRPAGTDPGAEASDAVMSVSLETSSLSLDTSRTPDVVVGPTGTLEPRAVTLPAAARRGAPRPSPVFVAGVFAVLSVAVLIATVFVTRLPTTAPKPATATAATTTLPAPAPALAPAPTPARTEAVPTAPAPVATAPDLIVLPEPETPPTPIPPVVQMLQPPRPAPVAVPPRAPHPPRPVAGTVTHPPRPVPSGVSPRPLRSLPRPAATGTTPVPTLEAQPRHSGADNF